LLEVEKDRLGMDRPSNAGEGGEGGTSKAIKRKNAKEKGLEVHIG